MLTILIEGLDALHDDTSMNQEQETVKANEIRHAASPKIRTIRTPEQLQKLDDLQKEVKQQRNQIAPANEAPPPQKCSTIPGARGHPMAFVNYPLVTRVGSQGGVRTRRLRA
jgi:hypothetical protein